MAEYIKFNQPVVNGMIIEVSGNGRAVAFVRRMVHRRNIVNIHITRHNHNAARMLAGCTFQPGNAFHQPSHISRMLA